jgi:hypothetical protein
MPTLVLSLFRLLRLLFSGHGAVAMENTALRVQLVAFQRKRNRPTLTCFDRLFWVGLSLLWTGWRAPWFTSTRTRSSAGSANGSAGSGLGGRDSTFHRMDGCRHPLWGAPRIHGELKMLGIEISERNCLPNPPEIAGGRPARPARRSSAITSARWYGSLDLDFPADCRKNFAEHEAPRYLLRGTAFMAPTFGRVSLRSKSKKPSQRPATPGRVHTPSG